MKLHILTNTHTNHFTEKTVTQIPNKKHTFVLPMYKCFCDAACRKNICISMTSLRREKMDLSALQCEASIVVPAAP